MRDDQQAGLARTDTWCDFACALEQQLGHHRVISNRLRIFPDLAVGSFCDPSVQIKLARNHRLREITFADKIRHHANFANQFWIEQEDRIAQARFFFPERALDTRKNFPAPDLRRMRQGRRARIGIHGRAVSDDEQGSVSSKRHAK